MGGPGRAPDGRAAYAALKRVPLPPPPRCLSERFEDRGPDVLLAGLCVRCGRVTTRIGPGGRPRHEPLGDEPGEQERG